MISGLKLAITVEKLSILFYELYMKQKQQQQKAKQIKGGEIYEEGKRDVA